MPLRAVCADEGWMMLDHLVMCQNDIHDRQGRYNQWAHITTTTEVPFFETTTTKEGTLYQPVDRDTTTTEGASNTGTGSTVQIQTTEDFDHPHSTEAPDLTHEIWMALNLVHSKGQAHHGRMCREVNTFAPSQKATAEERDTFFNELQAKLNLCKDNSIMDLWEELIKLDDTVADQDTIVNVLKDMYDHDGQHIYPATTASCADAQLGGHHRADWISEWHKLRLDLSYLEHLSQPQVVIHHSSQDTLRRRLEEMGHEDHSGKGGNHEVNMHEMDIKVLQLFDAVDVHVQDAICAVAQNYKNVDLAENWWDVSLRHAIPYHDNMFWITRMGRVQNWGNMALNAISNAPHGLLKIFAENSEHGQMKCNEALGTVGTHIGDIWDETHMRNFKEHQVQTRYLMKRCHDMQHNAHVGEHRRLTGMDNEMHYREHSLDVWAHREELCAGIDSWTRETTVGTNGDVSIDEFLAALLQCHDKVAEWMGALYNQHIDYPDAQSYCQEHVHAHLEGADGVMLRKFAFWEFNDLDRHFNCLEHYYIQAQQRFVDSAVHTCALMATVDNSTYMGMNSALENVAPADMGQFVDLVNQQYTVYTIESAGGWVSVARENDNLVLRDVPGLEITFKHVDADDQVVMDALQDDADVGLATMLVHDGKLTTAQFFDLTEADVLGKVPVLSILANNGFSVNGETVQVDSIALPPHFDVAHRSYMAEHGAEADYVHYVCAINPDAQAGKQLQAGHGQGETHEGEESGNSGDAAPAAEGGADDGAQAEPEPGAQAEPAPAAEMGDDVRSSSAAIAVMALSTAAVMMY